MADFLALNHGDDWITSVIHFFRGFCFGLAVFNRIQATTILTERDTVEKLQIFRPDKTICVLSFLSNLTHGGDHINRDLFLQSHC